MTCPQQKINSEKVRIRYKACFDREVCGGGGCSLAGDWPTLIQKLQRVYYFDREQYLANRRKRNIDALPFKRKKLRLNVEATISKFMKPLNHKGKLRVRGKFKTIMYAWSMGISISFGRIHRYLAMNPELSGLLGLVKDRRCLFLKKLVQIGQKVRNIFRFVIFKVKIYRLLSFRVLR